MSWPVRHDPPPCSSALPTHLLASSQTSASFAFGPTSSPAPRYPHSDIHFAASTGSLASHAASQGDRLLLASLSRLLPRSAWSAMLPSPETLLRWHRDLVRRKWAAYRRRPPRRCRAPDLELRGLI